MSFQSQGERANRATSRLLGTADAVILQSCVRLALLIGFAAVAWLLSGYVVDSVAHAEPMAEEAPTPPADGDAAAMRAQPLAQLVAHPGRQAHEVAAGNNPREASAPSSMSQQQLLRVDAEPVGDEVVVVSTSPLTSEPERTPYALTTLDNPITGSFSPLGQVAETLLSPMGPTAFQVVDRVTSGMSVTSPVAPVRQEHNVTQTPTSDAASSDMATTAGDAAMSPLLMAAPDTGGTTVLPELETHLPQGLPGIPGANQGGMGNVSGNSGSSLGSPVGGAGVMATEYAAPTMSDVSVAGASEVTHVNPDVLEDPTFSPD